MMRVLGLVFAFIFLLLAFSCIFCCFACCCCCLSVNCLLLILNCFVVLFFRGASLCLDTVFLFVVTVGFVENCLFVVVALNGLELLLLLLLLESSTILCKMLKLLKSSNSCIDGDDIGDSIRGFQIDVGSARKSANQRARFIRARK